MSSLLRTALVLVATVVAAGSCASGARAATVVGIGEQNPAFFASPRFQALGIKRARVIVPWDVAMHPAEADALDAWLAAAREAGADAFVHFGAARGRCPRQPCHLPSVGAYAEAFRAFHARWPFVRSIGVWNEANHRSQPTFRHPRRAAEFYNAVRGLCPGCRIVAADVLDDRNMARWLTTFKRFARRPRLWGLHNYRDTNPRRGQLYGGTRRLLSLTRGRVWLTESGGIVKFVLPDKRTLFRFSEARANDSIRRLFGLAKRYRRRISRIYLWGWQAPSPLNRFDSGLLTSDGRPRPSYFTLKRFLRTRYFIP